MKVFISENTIKKLFSPCVSRELTVDISILSGVCLVAIWCTKLGDETGRITRGEEEGRSAKVHAKALGPISSNRLEPRDQLTKTRVPLAETERERESSVGTRGINSADRPFYRGIRGTGNSVG